jgi:hypothetical protein
MQKLCSSCYCDRNNSTATKQWQEKVASNTHTKGHWQQLASALGAAGAVHGSRQRPLSPRILSYQTARPRYLADVR